MKFFTTTLQTCEDFAQKQMKDTTSYALEPKESTIQKLLIFASCYPIHATSDKKPQLS